MNTNTEFNQSLLQFIAQSPTPFHAVETMKSRLSAQGFEPLYERDEWVLTEGGKYFVTRNDSSLIAFTLPSFDVAHRGYRMIGAHTDSPCLKLKPNAQVTRFGHHQLAVEVYGGVLLHTWLDRDLSLAGRVTAKLENGDLASFLIDFKRPLAYIPNLAIHLNRTANEGFSVNPQEEILPIIAGSQTELELRQLLAAQIQHEHGIEVSAVLDFELSLYDTQAPALVGLHEEYIAAARLDNLLSCFVGLEALLAGGDQQPAMLICTDHEEVGSLSSCGANGPFLEDILRRISPIPEQYVQALQSSMLISADNAHAQHPNYASKHDARHAPVINQGAVIKVNNNQRYASNSETAAVYRDIAAQLGQTVQTFVVRSDMACGSTIGPITAGQIGVPTLDIGLPTFGMHSIRELAGSQDAQRLTELLTHFCRREKVRP
ncbi:M18 family aminopeptidase [Maribrevibacterium harenarium]|uniref:M18 family aminopeptidase n=1 Tax=Maribrevibacterium harenarium TaxID=2589817 RepID=A0A501WKK7_9GAMM|nr:M18 family aminopeptidase [Maribrevibacterium harenarium]TPE47591.1 M18 family aminopeptidase [Maribrevibacterium harenarium]